MFYKQRVLAVFCGQKDSAVGINKLLLIPRARRSDTCTAALATGTSRAVFSTSKVCQDALFIKHKYAKMILIFLIINMTIKTKYQMLAKIQL